MGRTMRMLMDCRIDSVWGKHCLHMLTALLLLRRSSNATGTDAAEPMRSIWHLELGHLSCGPLLLPPHAAAAATGKAGGGGGQPEKFTSVARVAAAINAPSEDLRASAQKALIQSVTVSQATAAGDHCTADLTFPRAASSKSFVVAKPMFMNQQRTCTASSDNIISGQLSASFCISSFQGESELYSL